MIELAMVLAEATAFDPATIGQYGVLGIATYLLGRFALGAYNREKERADANAAEVARLNQLIQDKYVPALEASRNALESTTEVLTEVQRQIYEAKKPAPRRKAQ